MMEILNRGEIVGRLTEWAPDMWYVEGRFEPAETPAGQRFVAAASACDPRVAHADLARGIRTIMRESPDDEETLLIVLSLSDERLFGRRVFEPDAAAWAMANVPE